jgi:hypothetical protein
MPEENSLLISERLEPEPSGVPFLPEDVFIIIIQLLEPAQIVRCRRVSKSWQNAFSSPDALRLAIKCWYPRSYDVRNFDLLVRIPGVDAVDVFDRVASRYQNLHRGRPWKIEKHPMHLDEKAEYPLRHYSVAPWERHTMDPPQEERPFRFQQPFWTVHGDYVVFLDPIKGQLLLLDLSTNHTMVVPLKLHKKIVRNVRLTDEVLAVEWAESTGSHRLNEEEVVHRHFATFFDVVTRFKETGTGRSILPETKVIFRNELKLHFFGLPLNRRDRFFSYHDQKHYAIYFWQPNRSMYTGDEEAPIESLAVWDISDPCEYQPSVDPSGHDKPAGAGPEHIMGLGFRELDFYDVRQRDVPSFTGVRVDDDNVYVIETADVWVTRIPNALLSHYQTKEFLWRSRSVSIPLRGLGPHAIDHCEVPPYS